jgi:hypothetical protein
MQDMIRSTARHFLDEYRSQLRTFEEYEVVPGVLVTRTGGLAPARRNGTPSPE